MLMGDGRMRLAQLARWSGYTDRLSIVACATEKAARLNTVVHLLKLAGLLLKGREKGANNRWVAVEAALPCGFQDLASALGVRPAAH